MAETDQPRRRPPGDPVFLRRVLSALVLGPVSLGLVILGGHAFAIFIAAFAAAMAWEWVRMSDKSAPPRAFSIATGTAVGAALLAAQDAQVWTLFWIVAGSLGGLWDRWPRGRAWETGLGIAYVAASVAILISLRQNGDGGLEAIAFLLAVVWAADTFAYLVGSWIGGPKLLPVASPNKTWAGLVAGLCFGAGAGLFLADWVGLSVMLALSLAVPTAIAAVIGDLMMSLAKRRFGVKDAGSLIPGHGGVLDRVDALMLATVLAGAVNFASPGLWPGGAG
ncbi:phosphatidate cytidylyltransferase [Maricaulaceae bacterium EIL42A08]|nr:phosphatidate cytidylyltransferase [Maricaulaceae bacterium EIL42A08]